MSVLRERTGVDRVSLYGIFVDADGADGVLRPVLYRARDLKDGKFFRVNAWAFDRNPADFGWRLVARMNVSGTTINLAEVLKDKGIAVGDFEYAVSDDEFHDRQPAGRIADFTESKSILKGSDSQQLEFVEGFEREARLDRAENAGIRIADCVKDRYNEERRCRFELVDNKAPHTAGKDEGEKGKGTLNSRLDKAKRHSDSAKRGPVGSGVKTAKRSKSHGEA